MTISLDGRSECRGTEKALPSPFVPVVPAQKANMKTILLTLAVSACAISLFAQGTVNFNNRNTAAGLFVPIYGPSFPWDARTGNSPAALPTGTQTYNGALLTGSGYMAQLFAAPGANAAESALVASANSITTFRTGTAAGAFAIGGGYACQRSAGRCCGDSSSTCLGQLQRSLFDVGAG